MKTERLYRKRKQKRYEERESRINTSAEEKGHEYIYIKGFMVQAPQTAK